MVKTWQLSIEVQNCGQNSDGMQEEKIELSLTNQEPMSQTDFNFSVPTPICNKAVLGDVASHETIFSQS